MHTVYSLSESQFAYIYLDTTNAHTSVYEVIGVKYNFNSLKMCFNLLKVKYTHNIE